MKKILISCILFLGAASLYAKDMQTLVVTTTPKMSCQNCENKIKGNLRFEKGIHKIETDLKNQTVTVTYDADKTDEAKIAEAFGKLNYKVTKAGEQMEEKACCGKCDEKKPEKSCCKGESSEKCKKKEECKK
ncbi:MAG: heavy-metal-associated domain-containing protein [Muribaculaceae bacterium]|nr:heavy-metal-associated domain-containing protein [Muribaculaceae bacterium]